MTGNAQNPERKSKKKRTTQGTKETIIHIGARRIGLKLSFIVVLFAKLVHFFVWSFLISLYLSPNFHRSTLSFIRSPTVFFIQRLWQRVNPLNGILCWCHWKNADLFSIQLFSLNNITLCNQWWYNVHLFT